MERIKNKIVLVNEAATRSSEQIIHHLLLKGAEVIVSSKNLIELYRLRAGFKLENALECRNLHLLPFDLRDTEDADAAKKIIQEQWNGLDAIVTNYRAARSRKSLFNSDEGEWEKYINNETKGQFIVAKTFMPLLAFRPGSMFIAVSKNVASHPFAGRGLGDVSMAIQLMLARNLSHEIDGNPSIHCLTLFDDDAGSKDEDHINLSNVAEAVTTLIENSDWVKGHPEFSHNWRQHMTPPDDGYCMGGI